MRNNEKRVAVLSAWRTWRRANPERGNAGKDAFVFHGYLLTERPDLLPNGPDDTWQKVHGWLLAAREVTD